MPRAQGFARGDLDTAFPLDDKFLALRGRLTGDRYYAAAGVYFHVVASTWREAERKVAIRVVPDASDLIADLIAVGLLDEDGAVPRRAFNAWVGRARKARKSSTDRQARARAQKAISQSSLGDTSANTGTRSPVHLSRGVTRMSRATSRDTAGTVGTEGTVGTAGTDGPRDERAEILDSFRRRGLPVDVA